MIPSKTAMLLDARAKARARGDYGVERAVNADLARMGVTSTPRPVPRQQSVQRPTGHAHEKKGPGRPPLPRCEHGQIANRCPECEAAA